MTGVPRRGRDDGDVAATAQPREEVNDKTFPRFAPTLAPETPRIPLHPRSDDWPQPADETRHSFHCTTRLPKPEQNDPGEIALGTYSLNNGVLRVYAEDGRMLGTGTLSDDAVAAARKVMREKRGKHQAFYDPITCRNPAV